MAVPLRSSAARFSAARSSDGRVPAVSSYREFRPAAPAAPAIACTWQGVPGWSRRLRLLPDGCLDLAWDGERLLAVPPARGPVRQPVAASALVTGIRLRPGWAGAALGIPARELAEAADLAELWGRAALRAAAELAAAGTADARRAALTRAVCRRLARADGPDQQVLAAVRALARPGATAGAAAGLAALSVRQLRRRFDEHVGLPPKTLQAVLRFQRLRARLATPQETPPALARAAVECGYFDQAHMSRDCVRLAGATPAALASAMAATAASAIAGRAR
jgi:AraC-like DNA-binding protein